MSDALDGSLRGNGIALGAGWYPRPPRLACSGGGEVPFLEGRHPPTPRMAHPDRAGSFYIEPPVRRAALPTADPLTNVRQLQPHRGQCSRFGLDVRLVARNRAAAIEVDAAAALEYRPELSTPSLDAALHAGETHARVAGRIRLCPPVEIGPRHGLAIDVWQLGAASGGCTPPARGVPPVSSSISGGSSPVLPASSSRSCAHPPAASRRDSAIGRNRR